MQILQKHNIIRSLRYRTNTLESLKKIISKVTAESQHENPQKEQKRFTHEEMVCTSYGG